MWNYWPSSSLNVPRMQLALLLALIALVARAEDSGEQKRMLTYVPLGLDEFSPYENFYGLSDSADDRPKRDDSARPGLLRFGKRDSEIPGLLRFGKRSQSFVRFGRADMISKKEMPGVLRFGKRSDMPGVLRFGKRSIDTPGLLRFGRK